MMRFTLQNEETPQSLKHYLKTKVGPKYSGRQLKKMIESGCAVVNNTIVRHASKELSYGDVVQFDATPQKPKINMIYEDEHYLIIDKPPNMLSEEISFRIVHRLDKDTSGVLLCAKSLEAFKEGQRLFQKRFIEKEYVALVEGTPEEMQGIVRSEIKGRLAETRWVLERTKGGISKLLCRPTTGRTHQIRVHLQKIGLPILGDDRYGSRSARVYWAKRQLLHAKRLAFLHPFTKGKIDVCAPLPHDILSAMQEVFGCQPNY